MRRATGSFLLAFLSFPLSEASAQQPGITMLSDSVVARIDSAFAGVGGRSAPGCAVGLARDGRTVLTRAYGMANLEYDVPNTPETIFESGSIAKQFTAAAVVLLAQDGKLGLDDDVRKYVPEVPDFGTTITIRHLLTHTSGLRDQWGLLSLKGLGPGTQLHSFDTILDLVAKQRALNFAPGSEYSYSNTGYVLAAIIVQRVSGLPFTRFSHERLFAPLGMTSTNWRDDFARVVKNRATAYDGTVRAGFRQNMPFTNVIGNGGLLTTVADLLRWNAFLDSPSEIAGGISLVRTLVIPPVLIAGKRSAYALGLMQIGQDSMRSIGHDGATAGYRTMLARYPDQRASVAVLCNAGGAANPSALSTAAVNAMLGRRPGTGVVARPSTMTLAPPTDLVRYAGLFRGRLPETVTRIVATNGQLAVVLGTNRALTHIGPDRFRLGTVELQYTMAKGRPEQLLQITGSDTTVLVPAAAWSPTPRDLRVLAGRYWSDELDTRLLLELRDTTLVVQRRPAEEVVLSPTFADAFSAPGLGTILFERNRSGAVTGFGIWAGRVRNVRFTRER